MHADGPSWLREPEGDSVLEQNWLFRLTRERSRSRKTGQAHDYYVIHLPDAVHVIAITPERQVVLVEQFRAGSGKDSLETPGGLIDQGEDPLEAGVRELLEETGYAGDPPRLIGGPWANPSLLSSRLFTIVVENARPVGNQALDETEELGVTLVPARRIPELLRNGRISHALCVQGLLWWLASELPQSPLSIGPGRARPGWQFQLGNMMVAIALLAVCFALLRSMVATSWILAVPAALLLAMVPAWFLLSRWIDPRSKAVLLREAEMEPTRQVARLLELLGLTAVLLTAAALVMGLAANLL